MVVKSEEPTTTVWKMNGNNTSSGDLTLTGGLVKSCEGEDDQLSIFVIQKLAAILEEHFWT